MTSLRNRIQLTVKGTLPQEGFEACLVGRAWVPGSPSGPSVVWIREDGVFDLSPHYPTMSELLESGDPAFRVKELEELKTIGILQDLLQNTPPEARDSSKPWVLAPCDLQAVKASGVTFVGSMLERVVEEQARGDFTRAETIRKRIAELIGDNLADIRPGSESAMRVKKVLLEQGAWSQYLEVGIGPDAEIFTKSQPMSAVGTGVEIGIHPDSSWNNPEPEIVLAVNSKGTIVGATLGNDVNLRDFEGRSALLLGKAKDNNASCAIGPFIRLFEGNFGLDGVRQAQISLQVDGPDGFHLQGGSSMKHISRDPQELVGHCMGPNHQYPDGLMLFLGTMFAPVEDRDVTGQGFTHKIGDLVRIHTPQLGTLLNRANRCDQTTPWVFGTSALMRNLAARGLL